MGTRILILLSGLLAGALLSERRRCCRAVTFTKPDELPDTAGTDRQRFRDIGRRAADETFPGYVGSLT